MAYTVNWDVRQCPFSGPNCTEGVKLAYDTCYNLVNPGIYDGLGKARVAECIFQTLSEFEKTGINARQYFLSLWPAIIGIIGAFGPDAGYIAYDNIWWSILFAVTSAGLPGLANTSPPHHVEVDETRKGEALCKDWEYLPQCPHSHTPRKNKTSKRNYRCKPNNRVEWLFFFLGLGSYCGFNVLFVICLSKAHLYGWTSPFLVGFWYWLSALPAFLALLSEVVQDRIDLYEPVIGDPAASPSGEKALPSEQDLTANAEKEDTVTTSVHPEASDSILASTIIASTVPSRSATARRFYKVTKFKVRFLSKWFRILRHQWRRRSEYRVLIRPQSQNWLAQAWALVIGLVRVTLFSLGSVIMGNVLLYPLGLDQASFVLLDIATTIPRVTWPSRWSHGAGGADLVVWVKPTDFDET